jgi:hypothetical protein
LDAENIRIHKKGGDSALEFYWILIYIAIIAVLSLTVRWILIYLMRRRASKTEKMRREKDGRKDGND